MVVGGLAHIGDVTWAGMVDSAYRPVRRSSAGTCIKLSDYREEARQLA